MRLLLTTIILTMLAQPVWANPYLADKFCGDLWASLHGTLDGHNELQAKWYKTTTAEERVEVHDRMEKAMEHAANTATVINVLCRN